MRPFCMSAFRQFLYLIGHKPVIAVLRPSLRSFDLTIFRFHVLLSYDLFLLNIY